MAGPTNPFRHKINVGFVCENCGREVLPLANGSCRNHCPFCLTSKHLDRMPGDRLADCDGLMECIDVQADARRGWMLVHRCLCCGEISRNRAALDDPRQPDDLETMQSVARQTACI